MYGLSDSRCLVVQPAPHNPLFVGCGVDHVDDPLNSGAGSGLADLRPTADATKVNGEQLPVGDDLDIHDDRSNVERRQVVALIGVADVRRLTEGDRPTAQPFVHGADGVAFDAPSDLIMNEERCQHLVTWHDAKELGVIA